MKKTLAIIATLTTIGTANAVTVRPAPITPNQAYNAGYNNGYRYGYTSGKSHERDVIMKRTIGAGLIVIGAVVLYNIATHKPVNQPVRTSVRF